MKYALPLSLLLVLLLSFQLYLAENKVDEISEPNKLRFGEQVYPLSFTNLNSGQVDTLSFRADNAKPRGSLLMVFSPNCPVCVQNLPNWLELGKLLQEKDGRSDAYYLSTFSDSVALSRYGSFEVLNRVLAINDVDVQVRLLKLEAVPTTIVADAAGKVLFSHVGVLSKTQMETLKKVLN